MCSGTSAIFGTSSLTSFLLAASTVKFDFFAPFWFCFLSSFFSTTFSDEAVDDEDAGFSGFGIAAGTTSSSSFSISSSFFFFSFFFFSSSSLLSFASIFANFSASLTACASILRSLAADCSRLVSTMYHSRYISLSIIRAINLSLWSSHFILASETTSTSFEFIEACASLASDLNFVKSWISFLTPANSLYFALLSFINFERLSLKDVIVSETALICSNVSS